MNLEQQVCSLELAKKLKELGVKQESLFYWLDDRDCTEFECEDCKYKTSILNNISGLENDNSLYSAFTVAELGEMLPDKIKDEDNETCWFYHDKNNNCHRISYVHACEEACSPFLEVKGEIEANARAKMLIYLIENKLIEIPE